MNEAVRILSVRQESRDTKTFRFRWDRECLPGQFIMIWIPGVDEIPMSLSSIEEEKSITVKAIGDATRKLHELKEGDVLHIRGPYGNGFTLPRDKRMLLVAGGVGMASLMPVVRLTGADLIFGARNSDEIIFEEEAKEFSDLRISTDDGSRGFHGNAVQLAKNTIRENGGYDLILGCGPEVMLYHLHRMCMDEGIECQLSLERHMKCGTGTCGACMMNTQRVCRDGPVFTGKQISEMDEFGRSKRDPSGVLVRL